MGRRDWRIRRAGEGGRVSGIVIDMCLGRKDVLFPSLSVRSSGGGWLWEGLVPFSLSGERRGGLLLVNQISGKTSRSERTWARARRGMRGVGCWLRCLKFGAKARGFRPYLGARTRCRRDVFLIRMMVTLACGKTFGSVRLGCGEEISTR